MTETELDYRIRLALFEGIGQRHLDRLLLGLGGWPRLFSASPEALVANGLAPKTAASFVARRTALDGAPARELMATQGITAVAPGDTEFPPLLREIGDPPIILFVRGAIAALTPPLPFAVVGTRRLSTYGETCVRRLVPPWARAGLGIMSGLALGTDAAAHAATLQEHGLTVAVLASGVADNDIGPRTNYPLAQDILDSGGALVSEYPPGMSADKHRFPRRNRIIAGLSRGLVVIEAPERSGALLTAELALQYNRDVFSVPGPITHAGSVGTNKLLRYGATPVTAAEDVFEYYGLPPDTPDRRNHNGAPSDPAAALILTRLRNSPLTADELALTSRPDGEPPLSASRLLAALTELELTGRIAKIGGQYHLV